MKQLSKSLWLCLFFLWLSISPTWAQCILFPGNLVFSGVNLDDDGENGIQKNDRFSFVLLQDLSENFEIYFTDLGWTTAGSFQSTSKALTDGVIKWTAPAGGVEAGTQITISAKYNLSASLGTVSGVRATPNDPDVYMDLGISGDQLFAFTGSLVSPTFVAGVNLNQSWTSLLDDKLTSSESTLPTGLSIANVQNLSLISSFQNGFTNAVISGNSFTGLFSAIVSSVNSSANWSFDEAYLPEAIPAGFQLPKSLSFNVTPFNFLNAPTGINTITYGSNTEFVVNKVDQRNIVSYQWEISTNGGTSFTPITAGGLYSGVATNTLVITKPPVSTTNSQYRVYAVDACGNETYSSPIALTVNSKPLTPSLVGTVQKERDGNTNAIIENSNLELNGVVDSDLVELVNPGTGTYASALPGTSIQVSVSGLSITGSDVANYVLNATTASANIGVIVDTTPPDGYTVIIDQDLINESNQSAVSFSLADAEIGATYQYSFTSSGGGTPVSGSGTVSSASQQITGINLSGLGQGTITLTLTLTDSYSNTGSPITDTSIKFINSPPTVANPIPNQSTDEDVAFNFQFELNTFQDPDDQVLSYTAQLSGGGPLPAWLTFNPENRTFSGTPTNSDVGTVSIAVTADDGNGGTVTDTFDITVINTNDAPTVVNPILDQFATQNAAFNFQFALDVFADIDLGDVLTYTAQISGGGELPTWLSFDGVNRRFSGTPGQSDVGNLDIDVIANDGNGGTVTDTFRITVVDVNDAPTVQNSIPNQDATEDVEFVFQFDSDVFFDLDGDELSYSAQLSGGGSLPGWLTFNPAIRTFSGTPTNSDVGAVSITVTADDGNGGTVTDTFDITVINVNDAPTVANPIPDQFATENSAFNFQFGLNVFNDIDVGDILTYTAQLSDGGSLPLWLSFDGDNRRFSGTPGNSDVGNLDIKVTASDAMGASVSDTFTLIVVGVNDAPVITVPLSIQVLEDVAEGLTGISFSDVDAGTNTVTVTFSVGSGSLAAVSGSGVTVSGTSSSLILEGSIEEINSFISNEELTFTTALNATADVTLSISISDNGNTGSGGALTDTANVTLQVTAVNDAPVNTVPGSQETDQNVALVFSSGNSNLISVSDVDAGGEVIRVTLTAINGLISLSGDTGLTFTTGSGVNDATMTIDGTIAAINSALNGLVFSPTPGYNGPASLEIISDDRGFSGSGGAQLDTDLISITVNSINPVVTSISSSSANGVYKIGDVLSIQVSFDQAVIVNTTGGSPSLSLETGEVDTQATYISGSESTVLSFSYTVQEGDFSVDLDYTDVNALSLNGAIIQNASGDDAIITLPTPGASGSLSANKNLGIDGIRPTATIVVSDTQLIIGETSLVTITFNEAVDGFNNGDLTIQRGTLSPVSSSDGGITWTATFTPTSSVEEAFNVITLDNTGVQDAAGNAGTGTTESNNYAIDTRRPTATITVSDTQLTVGESTVVTINFSEAVTGLSLGDFIVSNGLLGSLSTEDNITYTAILTPLPNTEDATNVIILNNTGFQDVEGNPGVGITDSNNYLVDTEAPTIQTQNITVQLNDTGNVSIQATQVDDNSTDGFGIGSLALSQTDFDCTNVGPNTVTLTVTDVNGNEATGTAIVTVEDNTAPVVNTENITIQLDATGNASITAADINNGSADACGIQDISVSQTDFDCSNVGTNTVILTVTDVNGNQATGTAIVTVEDNIAPVVTTQDITIQLDDSGNASITAADINNGSTDTCGIQSITASQTDFDCTNLGENTVTLTVTDVNGNTSTGTAIITVEDNIAPVPDQAQLPVLTLTCILENLTAPTGSDNCGGIITATTNTELPITESTVIIWTFADSNGNVTVQTQEVSVVDTSAPVITDVPEDFEVILYSDRPYVLPDFTQMAKATDNCTLTSFTQSPAAGTVYTQPGEVVVTLTATDRFNNVSQLNFNITLSNRLIIGLDNPGMITVPWNTPLSGISLPPTITVTLSNGEVLSLPVNWNSTGYNPLLAAVYQLEGTLELGDIENPEDLRPSLLILVEDKLAPTEIILSNTGFRADISTDQEIGVFSTVDPQDNIHNYGLVNVFNNDGKYFRLEGNRLYLNTTDPLPGKTRFTIVVSSTDRGGNTIERTFVLERTRIPLSEVVIFNSFTPNGDGKNDTWGVPELAYFRGGRVQVFERDGRRVFYTESPEESWDGTFEGKELPTGTYIWTLESRETGEVRRGVLTLMRD